MISTVLDYIAQNPRLFIGNAWGLVAAVFSFCTYQAKNEKRLLILQTGVIIATILSYATLGAWSGMALNIVCLLRNLVFFAKNTKVFSHHLHSLFSGILFGAHGIGLHRFLRRRLVSLSRSDGEKLKTSKKFRVTHLHTQERCPVFSLIETFYRTKIRRSVNFSRFPLALY